MSGHGRTSVARAVDGVAALVAAVNFGFVVTDMSAGIRPVVALLFVVFVPGWAAVRSVGAPLGVMSLLGAVVLSIAVTVLTAMLLVEVFDWRWRPAAAGWSAACVVTLAFSIVRSPRAPLSPRSGATAGLHVGS